MKINFMDFLNKVDTTIDRLTKKYVNVTYEGFIQNSEGGWDIVDVVVKEKLERKNYDLFYAIYNEETKSLTCYEFCKVEDW